MTNANISIEIRSLAVELTVLASAMELSVTAMLMRIDVGALHGDLVTLQDSAGRVAAAASVLRDAIGSACNQIEPPANED